MPNQLQSQVNVEMDEITSVPVTVLVRPAERRMPVAYRRRLPKKKRICVKRPILSAVLVLVFLGTFAGQSDFAMNDARNLTYLKDQFVDAWVVTYGWFSANLEALLVMGYFAFVATIAVCLVKFDAVLEEGNYVI